MHRSLDWLNSEALRPLRARAAFVVVVDASKIRGTIFLTRSRYVPDLVLQRLLPTSHPCTDCSVSKHVSPRQSRRHQYASPRLPKHLVPEVSRFPFCTAGAGRGIGLAAVELFLEEGAKVLASDVDLSEAQSKLKESDKLAFVKADVTDEAQVEAMFKTAMDKWGQVDSCIPNAGIFSQVQPWTDTPVSDVRLDSPLLCIEQLLTERD